MTKKISKKKAKSKVRKKAKIKKNKKAPKKVLNHVNEVVQLLDRYYPNPKCALIHENPLQLLIATILSAQCTDARVNIVTVDLFKKYKTAKDFADADISELENAIFSTGFYKNKAKNIKACCKDLVEKYNGEVPNTLDQLVKLAGVGRKTANVVLGNVWNIAVGIVVDTHVTRISNRLGFVKSKNAQIIERELMKIIPKEHWVAFSHWLIEHGRNVCKARKPLCNTCFLEDLCPKKL